MRVADKVAGHLWVPLIEGKDSSKVGRRKSIEGGFWSEGIDSF